jgi:hypothetical protein
MKTSVGFVIVPLLAAAGLALSDAKLIFAATTPVSTDLHHSVKDSELAYNLIAVDVMAKLGVQVSDLWAFAKPRVADIQEPGNPHFTAKGSRALAKEIASLIESCLK